jgi:uncharacterized ferritin-like protein (DUF455 family)
VPPCLDQTALAALIVGDEALVAVLEIVLRDEVGHVALGDHWFGHLCVERGLKPEAG